MAQYWFNLAVQAEDRARVAETKLTNLDDSLLRARNDLDKVERNLKAKKLWWAVNNPTNSKLFYDSKILWWNGEWGGWVNHQIDARTNVKMWSPPGAVGVRLRYNVTIGAGKAVPEERAIHAQLFELAENPDFGEIDPVYEFRLSANGREVHLLWLKR